jgi:glucose/mannose transport system substrate-binding protein
MDLKRLIVTAVLAALVTARAPASAVEAPAAPKSNRVMFYTWWASPSESAALRALVDMFKARYPTVSITTPVVPGNWGARNLFPIIKGLVAAGGAPEAFQMHAGYGAQPFFDAGLLSPIDDLWASEGLEKVMPPLIQDLCKIQGHYYSVPIGVHRINVIWYNKPLLERHGIDPNSLTTWEALFKAADTLRAKGVASPIQLGETWTAGLVFQGIMASQGMDTYEQWVNGRMRTPDDPKMVEAFERLKTYLTYVNPDYVSLGWDTALKRIINGEGAFYVMGDWANGEFRLAQKKYGKDYGTMPVPGTKNMYGVTIDTFLHPRGVASPTNSDRWLRLGASREGQDAFNSLKGSVPARNDPDVTRYDLYQRSAIADLKAARSIYPSVDSAVPYVYETALLDILAAFESDHDVKKAARMNADATRKLAPKFIRSWSLQ